MRSTRSADAAGYVCPVCRGPLATGSAAWTCTACRAVWPVRDGFARLLDEAEVRGNDRLLRPFYEYLAPLHDPAVKYTLPLFGSGTEGAFRRAFLPYLRLHDAWDERPADQGPLRILEVGIGSGANVPLIEAAAGGPVEVWGVDLAAGMLRLCRRRGVAAHLAVADAHALPFADASFDRVFHVGATNSYRDPHRALAEMARVARPGTPIVVVDERLDPARRHDILHRAIFRAICFYEPYPRPPTTFLPPGAWDVQDVQIARFLYCLSFRA